MSGRSQLCYELFILHPQLPSAEIAGVSHHIWEGMVEEGKWVLANTKDLSKKSYGAVLL